FKYRNPFISVKNSHGPRVVVAPVRAVQPVQAHRSAGARRVDEAALADIDADVADAAFTAEEHQVGRHQSILGDAGSLERGQFARGAGQSQVEHVEIDVVDQPAAVEPAFRGIAAVQ